MNDETGAPHATIPPVRTPIRSPRAKTRRMLAVAVLALTAPLTTPAAEDPGARAAQPCKACHDRGHFETLRWETYRAGLAGHPAANGIVVGLSEEDRRAIARHFGIPGTPEGGSDAAAESRDP